MNEKKIYRIVIAGDLLPWGNNVDLFKDGDAKTLFSDKIYNLFSVADFSIINLEGPLTESTKKQQKIGPVIKAEKNTINGIKELGVKAVALANNHVTDYLDEGYIDTVETLKSSGITYVGVGPNKHEIITYLSFLLGERKICIYNVSESFFNAPSELTAGVNLYDEYRVCNEIRELKAEHDYIIVIYHGGAEYFPYPTPQTRQRFHRMVDSGADFITAQHTHCIGCEEYYKGSYLLYGQGNFLFAKQSINPITKEGFVIEIVLEDNVQINKYHVELNDKSCLDVTEYKNYQDFCIRNERIDDVDFIASQFEKLKPNNIIDKYMLAFKGESFWERKLKRLIPQSWWRKMIESYTQNQIMRNQFVLTSDRAREDVFYIWNHIKRNN